MFDLLFEILTTVVEIYAVNQLKDDSLKILKKKWDVIL